MLTTLHTLLETRYTELAIAMDEIAERIQALGAFAPGSWSAFSALSNVEEETARREAKDMIRILGADQRSIVAAARKVIEAVQPAGDQATMDLGVSTQHSPEEFVDAQKPFGVATYWIVLASPLTLSVQRGHRAWPSALLAVRPLRC